MSHVTVNEMSHWKSTVCLVWLAKEKYLHASRHPFLNHLRLRHHRCRTTYTGNRVLQANGVAVIGLLWVIYFTSPHVGSLAMELGYLRGTEKEEESHGKVEMIGRNRDAFAMSPVHAGGSSQRLISTPTMLPDGGQSLPRPNVAYM